jgi:hypothetical protein
MNTEFKKKVSQLFLKKIDTTYLKGSCGELGESVKTIDYDYLNELVNEISDIVSADYEPKKCIPDAKYVKDLEHFKDTTIGLYVTDKEPELLFEEIFVHLIEKIGMDGEKTFSAMDYDYYRGYFNKGIKLLMWEIS